MLAAGIGGAGAMAGGLGEVAVFIDLENWRYGLLNNYGLEPDVHALLEKARKYGRPTILRAYADFSEHPPEIQRNLQIGGIECINVMVKRSLYSKKGKDVERVKNASDMILALDAMGEAVDADGAGKVKTFLLVTGDGDYVKLVTQLKNRFGQKVVICGVPESTAHDLVTAAGEEDPIDVPAAGKIDKQALKTSIVKMVKKGPAPMSYWSLRTIDQWCQDGRQAIPGTAKERRDAISELVAEGVLGTEEFEDPKRGKRMKTTLSEGIAKKNGYL